MIQTDTLSAIRDTASHTISTTAEAVDSMFSVSDSLLQTSSNTLCEHTGIPFLFATNDSLITDQTAHTWPVTLWGDTIVAPQSMCEVLNTHGSPLPYSLFRDNCSLGILIGCFLLVVVILAFSRKLLMEQMRNFFIPSNNQEKPNAAKNTSMLYATLVMAVSLCACNGLLLFSVVNQHYDLQAGLYSSTTILGICIACFVGYNLLRWLLYRFVNWIFFQKGHRHAWDDGFAFLLTSESILLFPVVLIALNLGWDVKTVAISLISLYGLTRILLLYHSYRIFFPKSYGLLHLFAYLCTLEMLPLLSLWKVLEVVSDILIVKY